MFNLLARGVLIAAGFVVSWFMTKDSPQFGIMEMAVAALLVMLIVAVLAFWPAPGPKSSIAFTSRDRMASAG